MGQTPYDMEAPICEVPRERTGLLTAGRGVVRGFRGLASMKTEQADGA